MALRTVAVRLVSHVQPYVAGMRRAQVATQQTAAQAATLGTGIKRAGTSMANVGVQAGLMRTGLVNPLTASAAAAVGATKAALDWESAWAGVQKTVDGSAEQMERLEGDLRGMARELPASHAEIAGVAEAAGQLGVEVDNVAEFSRTMIDLGESTNMSAEQAAVGLARFSNIMGTAEEDTRRLGSTLVDLGNNSATTEAEILELSTRLAAAAEIIGLSEAETMAFAATMSSVGVEAQAGGTALSKVFTTMRDAVLDGSSELRTFAQVAGTTATDFARRFREDPAAAVAEFIAGLGRMNEAGQSTSQVFADLGLQDQRLMRALLSTAEAGDLLTDSIELASDAWRENTALTEEAARRYETDAAKIETAWGKVKDAAITAGGAITPALGGAADAFGAVADQSARGFDPVTALAMALTNVVVGGEDAEEETESFLTKLREGIEDAIPDFIGKLEEAEGGFNNFGMSAEEATEHLQEYHNQLRAATDPVFAMFDAVQQVDEAQRNYNEAVDKYGKNSPEAEAASIKLAEAIAGAEAAAINGDLSFEEFSGKLDDWVQHGIITKEQADVVRGGIKELRGEAENYEGPYSADILVENIERATSQLDGVERRARAATKNRTLHLSTSGAVAAARRAWNLAAAVSAIPSFKSVRIGYSVTGRTAGVVHTGGEVMPGGQLRRFHSGGPVLARDEVPAILQTGEVVLSRRQVDLLSRALAPVASRAMPAFHSGGMAVGGGAMEFRHTFVGRGGSASALANHINYMLRRGELNIKTEAVAR